jgi:hypothetical protein
MEDIVFIAMLIALAVFFYPAKKEKPPSEKVAIILGDKSGQKNAITVGTKNGQMRIDEPLTEVKIKKGGTFSKPVKISKEKLEANFGSVMKAIPPKPFSVNIFFKKGLVPEAEYREKISEVLKEISKREPCEVDIIGYTDTKGSEEKNLLLSRKRAEQIKKILEAANVKIDHINIKAYGESMPLVVTDDDVAEPKNRRVEVIVK